MVMILIFITFYFDLLRFTTGTWETQGDFSRESIISQQLFVGIILSYLKNVASNFQFDPPLTQWWPFWIIKILLKSV